ncbi:hypothetical protein Tco_1076353 [Tanacetum coccineum]
MKNLDKESYHKLFDILKEYPNEVNEIRAEKLARNANPLALVAAAQYYPKIKGKEVVKPVSPPSESASDEDNDELRGISKFKNVWHSLQSTSRTSTNLPKTTLELHQTPGTRIEICLQRTGMTINLSSLKPKRVKDYAYHKENMMLCKQDEKGVPLKKIQEVFTIESRPTFDVELLDKVDSNVIFDSSDMCDNDGKDDQNAEEYEDERVVLDNLIANLNLDTDENKKIQKQLKKANSANLLLLSQMMFGINVELPFIRKRLDNLLNKPITHEITVLVKDLLMPLAEKTKANANEFVKDLKEEMFDNLQYVQSLEKELDELQSDKTEFLNEYNLLLQECLSKDILCAELSSMTDIDKYSEMA